MPSKPQGTQRKMSQLVRAKKVQASRKSGNQHYAAGRAVSRLLDQFWGESCHEHAGLTKNA